MFTIIGKRFTPDEFDLHVKNIALSAAFCPTLVVVHNTSSPTLAQRADGFTTEQMGNLQHYYAVEKKWNGGPHCFVDDRGIWVFNPLDRRGTHSPSWNNVSWGVEMLGEYESEAFTSGRGAKVRDNAVRCVAALLRKIKMSASDTTIKFHKEDPKTDHKSCPGKNVSKVEFVKAISGVLVPAPAPWTVTGPAGTATVQAEDTDIVRLTAGVLGAKLSIEGKKITLTLPN